jgi:hypothetical protein
MAPLKRQVWKSDSRPLRGGERGGFSSATFTRFLLSPFTEAEDPWTTSDNSISDAPRFFGLGEAGAVGGIAEPALVSRRILRVCGAAATVEEEDILEVEG